MKAILQFDLPEEREEFEMHNKASEMFCKLADVEEYVRRLRKYDTRESIPTDEIVLDLGNILND